MEPSYVYQQHFRSRSFATYSISAKHELYMPCISRKWNRTNENTHYISPTVILRLPGEEVLPENLGARVRRAS